MQYAIPRAGGEARHAKGDERREGESSVFRRIIFFQKAAPSRRFDGYQNPSQDTKEANGTEIPFLGSVRRSGRDLSCSIPPAPTRAHSLGHRSGILGQASDMSAFREFLLETQHLAGTRKAGPNPFFPIDLKKEIALRHDEKRAAGTTAGAMFVFSFFSWSTFFQHSLLFGGHGTSCPHARQKKQRVAKEVLVECRVRRLSNP